MPPKRKCPRKRASVDICVNTDSSAFHMTFPSSIWNVIPHSARSVRHPPSPSAFHLPHAHTCHPPGTPAMNGGLLFRPAVPGSVRLLPPGTPILNRTMPESQARSRRKSQSPPTASVPAKPSFRSSAQLFRFHPALPLTICPMRIPVIHLERPQ